MAQILGLGVTHSPPLLSASSDTASRIKRMMQDPLRVLPQSGDLARAHASAMGQRRGPDACQAASR